MIPVIMDVAICRCLWPSSIFIASLLVCLFSVSHEHSEEQLVPSEEEIETSTRMPIDLAEIGYSGTWEEFCSPEEIENDYGNNTEHELRVCRENICKLKANNEIKISHMQPFVLYRYISMVRPTIDHITDNLLLKLSLGDAEKKRILIQHTDRINASMDPKNCAQAVVDKFESHCMDDENPYFELFLPLLIRACTADWLNEEKIKKDIKSICKDKRINIEWNYDKLRGLIKYRV